MDYRLPLVLPPIRGPQRTAARHELTFGGFLGLPGLLFWGSAAPVVGSWELSAASSPCPLMVPAAAAPPFLPVNSKKKEIGSRQMSRWAAWQDVWLSKKKKTGRRSPTRRVAPT